jgi:zinc and cadmium transporter
MRYGTPRVCRRFDAAEFAIATAFYFIVVSTLAVALASVGIAAQLSFRVLARFLEKMVSFSIGILLATTFLHLLPEAFESGLSRESLFAVMLAGLLGFFFLQKIALYRHSHHYEGDGHSHEHGHDAHLAGRGGALVLVGSAFHNFSDGILIAGAFLAGPMVGLAATLAIFTHEVPHKVGDFMVLLNAGIEKRRALQYAIASGCCIVAGGLVGYFLLDRVSTWIPYVLVIAAAAFLYISLSDLVPRMQRARSIADALWQGSLIAVGVVVVLLLNRLLEGAH